jgi:3'-phosphoadenosine 5'-phosphosulfate sulfotransferase (PAPS reductase)/FAD synthetase
VTTDQPENDTYRKQAPGRPQDHPDWFWSISGGIDSVAAYLVTKDIGENFAKTPTMAHFDTRIGLPFNRLYVERLADWGDEYLTTIRTPEKFEEWVEEDDCPGAGAHPYVRNEVKGRQAGKLATWGDPAICILGLRAEESDPRAEMDKVEQKERHIEVRPVHRLTKRDCVRIILEHDAPINPAWLWPHPTDCFCMCNGDPSELDAVEERFPEFAQRLREIEEAADPDGFEGSVLGWDGLSANEKRAKAQGQDQMTLCGESCGRKTVGPRIEKAVRARLDGQPPEECIAILDDETATNRGVVPA